MAIRRASPHQPERAAAPDAGRLPRRGVILSSSAGIGCFCAAGALNRWPGEAVALVVRVRSWWRASVPATRVAGPRLLLGHGG